MSGKGSSPRPFDVSRETYEANWDRIFGSKDVVYENDNPLEGGSAQMWEHHCGVNGRHLVGSGESCSWCGENEDGTISA